MSTPTTAYAELEIGLHRTGAAAYQVELRFTDPASEAEIPPARGWATFDLAELLALRHDPLAYGQTLAERLFDDENVRGLLRRARTKVEAGDFLRLQLRVDPSAGELHALYWELLRDPESNQPLAASEKAPFSRFMVSHDWRPVKLRPKADLRALVAVAAPSNLAKYQLAEVDRDGEIARARTALRGIEVTVLGDREPLTLERLVDALRGGVDVLYLVCHGALIRQIPRLYLQNEEGEVAVASGDDLAERISELTQAPRLVVLASCASPGAEPGSAEERPAAEATLAPRLAEAGVPAILAVQGKISTETLDKAMPVFFAELLKDGQVDRALAVARSTVGERPDAWMPALFVRLKGGRIWYVPGFGGEEGDFSKWPSIVSSVRQGRFIPIVAADVGEHVFGSTRDLACRLGELHGYPLACHDLTDLAKVAQYLSIAESRSYARDEVLKELHKQALRRHPEGPGGGELSLPKLLDAVVAAQDQDAPFRILAELPASVYVTAGYDPLLLKSLRAAGREPTPLLCDWRPTEESHPREPPYQGEPKAERPIVYHVFGVLGKPDSLVLTEDDVLDYLLATAEYKLMPTVVRGLLTSSSLLFLGFRLEEFAFRALFRLIMTLGGSQKLRDFAHVGVQVNPEEYGMADVERAREYLEEHYGAGGDTPPISIYWGTAADFLRELRRQVELAVTSEMPALEEDDDDWLS